MTQVPTNPPTPYAPYQTGAPQPLVGPAQPGPAGGAGRPGPRGLNPVTPPGPDSRRTARTAARRQAAVRSFFEGTPGRLRLLGIGAVLACLVLSLVGSAAFSTRQSALADARADAAQLIRVQEIATQLVKADSLFTNGYLAYGLESPANLTKYDAALTEASSLIAEASRANGDDAAELAKVNAALSEYTARVASARANNNQGYQVATGYLRQASDLLRGNEKTKIAGMLPTLQQLMGDNSRRVDDAYSRSGWATWILLATVLLGLGGLIAVQVRLARLSRRYLNVPLVGASGAVLLVLATGAVVMIGAQSSANRVYDSSYTALQNVATARIQAYTAKSAESISLIYRGTGGDFGSADNQYEAATKEAAAKLTGVGGTAELDAWKAAHQKVITTAGGPEQDAWQRAAKEASADGSAINSTFDALDTVTGRALERNAAQVDSGLTSGHLGLILLTWIAVVVGVVAAAAGWGGIAQRLEEYR